MQGSTCLDNTELSIRVERELRRLRIPGTMKGLYYLSHAVSQCVSDPKRIQYITKDLYPETADLYGTEPRWVERVMRTAIRHSWANGGKETLLQMAGYHLEKCPSNAEFIDIVAFYIRSTSV